MTNRTRDQPLGAWGKAGVASSILKTGGETGTQGSPFCRESGHGQMPQAFAGNELWSVLVAMLALTSFLRILAWHL